MSLLGRVIDGVGQPLDGLGPILTAESALLVNRRGLRAEEESLISLARKLAAGSAQLLDRDASPARSAWEETLDSLLPLAGDAPQGQGSGSGGSNDPKGGR